MLKKEETPRSAAAAAAAAPVIYLRNKCKHPSATTLREYVYITRFHLLHEGQKTLRTAVPAIRL